jgi:hypothetical protein
VDVEKEAWNKLIDANVRSGIMACVFCMKGQVIKIIAQAFHKWKYRYLYMLDCALYYMNIYKYMYTHKHVFMTICTYLYA